eukprot:GHVT01020298.1.p1 GENE.GHVT01020298.1~~GHVT01020298.1.p1  ORF type:complete len:226 (-),score=58.59 GHVT01020298.1:995-1672(-)
MALKDPTALTVGQLAAKFSAGPGGAMTLVVDGRPLDPKEIAPPTLLSAIQKEEPDIFVVALPPPPPLQVLVTEVNTGTTQYLELPPTATVGGLLRRLSLPGGAAPARPVLLQNERALDLSVSTRLFVDVAQVPGLYSSVESPASLLSAAVPGGQPSSPPRPTASGVAPEEKNPKGQQLAEASVGSTPPSPASADSMDLPALPATPAHLIHLHLLDRAAAPNIADD